MAKIHFGCDGRLKGVYIRSVIKVLDREECLLQRRGEQSIATSGRQCWAMFPGAVHCLRFNPLYYQVLASADCTSKGTSIDNELQIDHSLLLCNEHYLNA